MIPIAGPSTCSDNVYVMQVSVGIGWLFLATFIPAFLLDCLFLVLTLCVCVSSIRLYRSRASITTAESMKKHSIFPPEFFQELISKGKMDDYLRCSRDVNVQLLLDQAQLNVMAAAFAEFYVLLNSLSPTAAIVASLDLYKSTDFGQQLGHFEVHNAGVTRSVPKHWKEHVKRFKMGPIRFLFSLTVQVLISIVYPALSFSSLTSCPSLQRTYNIMVMVVAFGSLIWTIFNAIKDSHVLGNLKKVNSVAVVV
jgi:hypothetical protein